MIRLKEVLDSTGAVLVRGEYHRHAGHDERCARDDCGYESLPNPH